MVFGFLGDPASHLVTHEGLMLRIDGADCDIDIHPSGCFVKDGNLGTLPGEESQYLALSDAPTGEIFSLVNVATSSYWKRDCKEAACIVQRVDVENRDVTKKYVTVHGVESV